MKYLTMLMFILLFGCKNQIQKKSWTLSFCDTSIHQNVMGKQNSVVTTHLTKFEKDFLIMLKKQILT